MRLREPTTSASRANSPTAATPPGSASIASSPAPRFAIATVGPAGDDCQVDDLCDGTTKGCTEKYGEQFGTPCDDGLDLHSRIDLRFDRRLQGRCTPIMVPEPRRGRDGRLLRRQRGGEDSTRACASWRVRHHRDAGRGRADGLPDQSALPVDPDLQPRGSPVVTWTRPATAPIRAVQLDQVASLPTSCRVASCINGVATAPASCTFVYFVQLRIALTNHAHQQNNQAVFAPPATPYPVQLEFMAKTSREVWQALGSVKDLPGSARVLTTLHHVVKRFRSRFSAVPPLSMFIDGLSNNKDMRPVRNINGLTCKACELGLGNAAAVQKEAQSVSLPKLANHFQSKHIELRQQTMPHLPPLDWVREMVLLKDQQALSGLRSALSLDSQKYYLLSDAFPEAFKLDKQQDTTSYVQQPQPPYPTQPTFANDHPQQQMDDHAYSATVKNGGEGDVRHTSQGAQHLQLPPESDLDNSSPRQDLRPSSRSYETGRRQPPNQSQKKGVDKNRSGKNREPNDVGRRRDEGNKRAEEDARREGNEIQAMWATDRATAARAATSSTKPDRDQPGQLARFGPTSQSSTPQTSASHQPRRILSQISTPRSGIVEDEPNLMAALEMHLDQGDHLSTRWSNEQPSSGTSYAGSSRPHEAANLQPSLLQYGQHPREDRHLQSPTYEEWHQRDPRMPEYRDAPSREELRPRPVEYYEQSRATRDQELFERQAVVETEPRHSSARTHERRYEANYQQPRQPPGSSELGYDRQLPESRVGFDNTPYHRTQAHQDDTRYDHTNRDRYGYPEESRSQPRGAVQEYEIVQVIDDQGEYYIRRPVIRRGPEQYHGYEEHGRVRREPEPYSPYEPVYSRRPPPPDNYHALPPRRSQLEPEPYPPRRQSTGPSLSRADPSYYEPYDPRNPTAAAPEHRHGYDRQQFHYGN